ncbi:hypothetical protein [Rhodobacter lacus]|uniref:SGNH hydrolase-type esterase domain-containing protein n=1 Tax=Rhodobacter lacus TaxID=1641972 RepID=A0ABW5A754_9RHOB
MFVFNSADFGDPSSWANPLTHPRAHPVSALAYLIERTLIQPDPDPTPPELQVPPRDPVAALTEVVRACDCDVHVWLYPTRDELSEADPGASALETGFAPFAQALGERITLHHVAQIPDWGPALYRDHIHPTAQGTARLAAAIAASLRAPATQ